MDSEIYGRIDPIGEGKSGYIYLRSHAANSVVVEVRWLEWDTSSVVSSFLIGLPMLDVNLL
jgi:hypothetical protein